MIFKKSKFIQSVRELFKLFEDLEADIERYVFLSSNHWLIVFLGTQGLWVITQYRVSRWIHFYFHLPIFRQVLKLICFFCQKIMEITTGAELPNRAEIGVGLLMVHTNGIVIHIDAKIGSYCNISQQVTIGIGGRGEKRGAPKLGDRVFVGPGAKIFGAITIGNDVAIGANAVVTKNLPDNAVAVGIPATIISYKGSQDFVIYRK